MPYRDLTCDAEAAIDAERTLRLTRKPDLRWVDCWPARRTREQILAMQAICIMQFECVARKRK